MSQAKVEIKESKTKVKKSNKSNRRNSTSLKDRSISRARNFY